MNEQNSTGLACIEVKGNSLQISDLLATAVSNRNGITWTILFYSNWISPAHRDSYSTGCYDLLFPNCKEVENVQQVERTLLFSQSPAVPSTHVNIITVLLELTGIGKKMRESKAISLCLIWYLCFLMNGKRTTQCLQYHGIAKTWKCFFKEILSPRFPKVIILCSPGFYIYLQ